MRYDTNSNPNIKYQQNWLSIKPFSWKHTCMPILFAHFCAEKLPNIPITTGTFKDLATSKDVLIMVKPRPGKYLLEMEKMFRKGWYLCLHLCLDNQLMGLGLSHCVRGRIRTFILLFPNNVNSKWLPLFVESRITDANICSGFNI